MYFTEGKLRMLKSIYTVGCRVVLIEMDDPHAPPKGTKGTVTTVDDIGTVHVNWDNGSTLGAVYGEDKIMKCKEETA